jgi:multicomponent K+:H+ antiporter subunit E
VSGRDDAIHPRRLVVPLALRTDEGVAALATMVTLTPGTISAAVAPDRRSLEVHVLHVEGDGDDVVQTIRDRYERPLLEIFG